MSTKSGCPTSAISRSPDHRDPRQARPVIDKKLLLTLESDKATLEVPSPAEGVIGRLRSRSATR